MAHALCRLQRMGRLMGILALAGLAGAGCASRGAPPPTPAPPPAVATPAPEAPGHASEDGSSLWSDDNLYGDLFRDQKARRIGDIVTIQVAESSSAENSAETSTERDSSLSAGIENFFGLEQRYLNPNHPKYKDFRDFIPFAPAGEASIKGGMTSAFEGSGTTSRTGDLNAFITARVVDVLPNGNLKIIGSREITVNNERQYLTLYGVIRPRDVSKTNVILSTYVADARIAYSGSGIIDDRQRPGWMANVINTIWPF
jgi:flagellar L-ring protein precursor FlgH